MSFYGGSAAAQARHLFGFRGLFLLRPRLGQRSARQHLVPHGRVIDEAGHDRSCLLEILLDRSLVDVDVGMVPAGSVVQRILDKLETGNAHGVEEDMIRAAGVSHRQILSVKNFARLFLVFHLRLSFFAVTLGQPLHARARFAVFAL